MSDVELVAITRGGATVPRELLELAPQPSRRVVLSIEQLIDWVVGITLDVDFDAYISLAEDDVLAAACAVAGVPTTSWSASRCALTQRRFTTVEDLMSWWASLDEPLPPPAHAQCSGHDPTVILQELRALLSRGSA